MTYKVSVQDVFEAIEKNNQNVGGNVIETPTEQYVIRGIGLIRDEADIGNIVLKSHDGVPVFIKDVAEVYRRHAIGRAWLSKMAKVRPSAAW